MNLLKLSDASKVIPIFMADSASPTIGKSGLTLSVTLSKNGAAFAPATGTVTELTLGHYYLMPSAADAGTLGPLVVRATAPGAVEFVTAYRVVAFDPYSAVNLGLTNLDTAISSRSTYSGGPVASVTAPVTVGTNNDKTGYAIAGNVTVGGYASGQDPATLVLDATAASHNAANSVGSMINAPGTGGSSAVTTTGDPWAAPLPGAYAPGTAGALLGGWVDAFERMLPTNFSTLAIDPGSGGITVSTNRDKGGYLLGPAGLDAVPVEANVNVRQALAPILAASAGVVSGAGTGTIVIKGGNVTDTRIQARTDKAGNRTAVTLTLPTLTTVPQGASSSYFPMAYFPMAYFPIGKSITSTTTP